MLVSGNVSVEVKLNWVANNWTSTWQKDVRLYEWFMLGLFTTSTLWHAESILTFLFVFLGGLLTNGKAWWFGCWWFGLLGSPKQFYLSLRLKISLFCNGRCRKNQRRSVPSLSTSKNTKCWLIWWLFLLEQSLCLFHKLKVVKMIFLFQIFGITKCGSTKFDVSIVKVDLFLKDFLRESSSKGKATKRLWILAEADIEAVLAHRS